MNQVQHHKVVVDGTIVTCSCDWLFVIDLTVHDQESVMNTIVEHTLERALAADADTVTGEMEILNDPFKTPLFMAFVDPESLAESEGEPEVLNCGYCGVPEGGDYVHVRHCPLYRRPTLRQRIRRWFH